MSHNSKEADIIEPELNKFNKMSKLTPIMVLPDNY